MKCGNCYYGKHYTLELDEYESVELVQCPFGDQIFRFPDKRCAQFPKRKEAERRDGYAEEISKTD